MRSRVYATVGRPSVRPSVCHVRLSHPAAAAAAAGLLLHVDPAARRSIDYCTVGGLAVSSIRATARRAAANADTATLSADVRS